MVQRNVFISARIQLTAWYVLLIMIFSGTISLLFFFRVSAVLNAEYQRLNTRIERQWQQLSPQQRQAVIEEYRITSNDLRQAKNSVLKQLLFINGGIVTIFAIGGYVLSGKTLEPIRRAHQDQRRFIGDAAHELKTPVTALKTSLEVNLLDDKLSKKTKIILEENLEDVTNLESLIKSLLRLAKIDESTIELERLNLAEIGHRAVKMMKKVHGSKVKLSVEGDDSIAVLAEKGMLLDLFVILLDNAIKYTDEGGSVSFSFCKKGRSTASISISDTGRGISAEHLPYIFKRFYRVDQARTVEQQTGHGLGLAVAKQIVKLLHGKILVQSEEGKGTTFTIVLPLAKVG